MKKIYKVLILFIIYLLTLGIRIYWLSQKEGLHVDEGYSIANSNYNDYMLFKNYDFYVEYTGKELKEMSLCTDDSIIGVFKDIWRLWLDSRDPPHTNLYYSLLRLSLAGLKTGEIKPIIIRGGILNLIFFTISFIFFFLIMKMLFPDSTLLQVTATACAFLSTATVTNTIFLRPYQIQETMFIVFCFCFIKMLDNKNLYKLINEKELFFNVKSTFFLSIITGITLLTGYYSIIFIGLFGLYVIYINYKTKNYSIIIFYIFVLILGLLFAQTFYSKYLRGYVSSRALQVNEILFYDFINNIEISLFQIFKLIKIHFFSLPVIIICIISLIIIYFKKIKFRNEKLTLSIFIFSLLYITIILFIAPFKTLRYIMPVFPFLVILPAIIINTLYSRTKLVAYITMLILFHVFIINSINKDNIEHLYRDKHDQFIFTENKDIYVVIHNKSMFKYNNLIPYLNNEQIYYFIEEHDDIYLCNYNEFYYLFNNKISIDTAHFKIEGLFEINGLEPDTFIHPIDTYFYGVKLLRINAGK